MMMWQRIFGQNNSVNKRQKRKLKKRALRMEKMERRELLASDLGVITGVAFIDQNDDGSSVGDPAVLVDGSGDLVAPGTAGAAGIDIELFNDTNTNGTFDNGIDTLVGTVTSSTTDGSYRFDRLTAGDYFLVQQAVPQLTNPAPQLVSVVDADGVRTQLIDDYSQTSQTVTAAANSSSTDSAIAPTANVVGGARDIQVTETNNSGAITLALNATNSELTLGAQGATAVGNALIQYDGNDGSIALDNNGLGGVSLGGGAAGAVVDPIAGISVFVGAQLVPVGGASELTITIYSGAGNASSVTVPITASGTPVESFVLFSNFTGNADFNNVGAIETSLTISEENDITVSITEAIQPVLTTANLASIQPITLGGEIFRDESTGGLNNGTREGSEGGVSGVTVDLYQLANPTDVVNPATQISLATTTTIAGGVYSFADLEPGHYAVVIPSNQFANGAPLFGLVNSTGNDPAPDPDNDTDGDDNGTLLGSGDVSTGTITLVSNAEPTNDADTDANTNTTLDLGFFPQVDLAITKTLNTGLSSAIGGGNAVFDIVVTNNGPAEATAVEVTDTFPAALTFTGLTNQSGTFTSNTNGQLLTVQLGAIASGAQATFRITSDIAASQTADFTNTATVATANQVDSDATNNSDDALVDLVTTDIRIEKTDLVDPTNAGTQLTYQVTVTNDGPDDATGVEIRDTLPAGVAFSSGNIGGTANLVTVDGATGEIVGAVGALANGASAVMTIIVDVAQDAGTPLTNNATVTVTPNTDPDLTNNTTSENTTINRVVDVSVNKTASGTIIAGSTFTYTVEVTNGGPGEARGVVVTDTLNADLTLVANSFNAGTSGVTIAQNGQDLTFTVGTLSTNQTESFTFDVTVAASATGTIPNTANITTTDSDSDTTNNAATETVTVGRQIDLVIDKAVDRATAVPGQDQLVYTFTVSHGAGSVSDAENIVVTDVLPSSVVGAVISAATADSTNFNNATNTVTVGFNTLPLGQTRTFTVTVDIPEDQTGTVVNPASVTSTGTELDNTNNSDTATTTLTPDFDVTVAKTVNDATPLVGGTVVYTVTVTNDGPSTATNVVLSDAVPAGMTFVSGTLNGVAGTLNGTTVTFPAVSLTSAQSITGTLNFTVNNTATGTITNTATVPDLSAAGENDVTNNSGTVDVTVVPVVDLAISKTVSSANATFADSLTYTVTVTNNGPSTASTVVVTDTLPAGVTFTSGTGPTGAALTATNGVVTVNGGDLANGGSFTFTVNGNVAAGATTTQTNTATVTSSTQESDSTNNTATATTTIDPSDGSIAGSVFIDANANGIRDAGETGIPNNIINLTGTDALGRTINQQATTDANGDYLFQQLAAGDYTITQPTDPAGFRDGAESAGTGAASSTVGQNTFDITVNSSPAVAAFNFGELNAGLSKRNYFASNQ